MGRGGSAGCLLYHGCRKCRMAATVALPADRGVGPSDTGHPCVATNRIYEGTGRTHARSAERWLFRVPFSVYRGRITVATIANVTAFLVKARKDWEYGQRLYR